MAIINKQKSYIESLEHQPERVGIYKSIDLDQPQKWNEFHYGIEDEKEPRNLSTALKVSLGVAGGIGVFMLILWLWPLLTMSLNNLYILVSKFFEISF